MLGAYFFGFNLNHGIDIKEKNERKMRAEGLEPPSREGPDPKSGVSTNFTTPANKFSAFLVCVSLKAVQIYYFFYIFLKRKKCS